MVRDRYDSQWKEVEDINSHVLLLVYATFVFRGLAALVVTWNTVVLLGGFVSMIDKQDFLDLTTITFLQLVWIDDSFSERLRSSRDMVISTFMVVKNLLRGNFQLADNARGDHPGLTVVKRVVAVVGSVLSVVHSLVFCSCIISMPVFLVYGLITTASVSIRGLMEKDHYGDKDEDRTNMDPAHNLLYTICVVQVGLYLYRLMLSFKRDWIVNQVSQAYGFQDGGSAVLGYFNELAMGCWKNPTFARERNLVTHAVELMESDSPLSDSCLSGTLILDRLLTRQYSEEIIRAPSLIEREEENQQQQSDLGDVAPLIQREKNKKNEESWKKRQQQHQQREQEIIGQQHRVIKQLIGSATSPQILQKLLQTLDSRRSSDRKMREAAARIVEHVADGIRLEQFPRRIKCISSLISTFEEYRRLHPYNTLLDLESEYSDSESNIDQPSSSIIIPGYKDLVLTGLRILWRLAGSEDNCAIISNTKHLVSKIMAPISYDLVHRTHHSAWSTRVVEGSLSVMLRLIMAAEEETRVKLCRQISSDDRSTVTMESIITCEKCKGTELQMKAMQILTQLCMDEHTASRGNLTKMLISIFVNGDSSNGSIRKTAGKTLVVLFIGIDSIPSLLPKQESDEFVGGLAKILLQVGDNDACRKSAAEILEHLCIHYAKNREYLSALKNAVMYVMPEVLREILPGYGSTVQGIPGYTRLGTDVESQVITKKKKKKNDILLIPPRENRHYMLHVPLLSLCVTAFDKLNLDLDAILLGEGRDPAECGAFSLALKMIQLNRYLITTHSLIAMKLTTRLVIAAMQKLRCHGTAEKIGYLPL